MAVYGVYSVSGEENLFTQVSKKEEKIKHPFFTSFTIKNKIKFIICEGTHQVELPFSQEEPVYGVIKIKVILFRHKQVYSIVGLSGDGLLSTSARSKPKYINENILPYIKKHIKKRYEITLDLKSFVYENDHFSTKYWGKNITTKYGYNSSNRLYIKITSSNLIVLLKNNPSLEGYYLDGIIKSIRGKTTDLDYISDGVKFRGKFKFNRNGIITWEFFDIEFFYNFIKKLIDKKFFNKVAE